MITAIVLIGYLVCLGFLIRAAWWLRRRDRKIPTMPDSWSHEYYGPEYWPGRWWRMYTE